MTVMLIKKTRAIFIVLITLVFSIVYSAGAWFSLLFVELFAMGCRNTCNSGYWSVFIGLILFILCLVIQFKLLSYLITAKWKRILLLIASFALIPMFARIIYFAYSSNAEKTTKNILNKMYAPFLYSQTIHPKVTVTSYVGHKDVNDPDLSSVDITMNIVAEHEGQVEILARLQDKILTDGLTIPSHRFPSDTKLVTISTVPTTVTFHILPSVKPDDNLGLQYFDTLEISMNYIGKASDYDASAILDTNPVFNIEDSGNSKILVLPHDQNDSNHRSLLYSIDLRK